MKSQADDKCLKCGGPIYGTVMHGIAGAHDITWARRGTTRGKLHVNPSCDDIAAMNEPEVILPDEDEPAISLVADTTPLKRVAAELKAAHEAERVQDAVRKAASKPAAARKPARKLSGSAQWFELLGAALASGARRILLVGPPGTGKSTTAQLIDGMPTYRLTMTPGTAVEDMLGCFQLVKGETKFMEGPAARAMREGARLLLDEITHAPEEIQALLYGLMDDAPQVMLPNGEYVKAADGYTVIATTNDPPLSLEPAILDRCEVVLLATTPHEDALKGVAPEVAAACANYYKNLNCSTWAFNRRPQVRPCRTFEMLRKAGLLSDELAASAVFGDAGREILSTISTAALKPEGSL